MTVEDISSTGMKLKLNAPQGFTVGDHMEVDFSLDDKHRTLIKKRVIVRNIIGPFVGVEFGPAEALDKALGFYLFS
jgi:hypothetical protein